ncbi:MAG TPA: glycerol kinase GlpK [Clostridiales bacterium]|nr:glycerol kinase GlpK [Clostridiales bacterium]
MTGYIMAFDQGTTSCRTLLYDQAGRVVATAQAEFKQYYPEAGWVEHDAMEILEKQVETARQALRQAGIEAKQVAAVGVTNQRETTVVWDKHSGQPINRAIVWQCRRTAAECAAMKEAGLEELFRRKTGLLLDPYFSGTKIKWLLDHTPGSRVRALAGDLLAGTIDSWLIWNLTGGAVHATDPSNACRTLIYNIYSRVWDSELANILDVPINMLPEVRPTASSFGAIKADWFGAEIDICAAVGDQQAALFGHGCFTQGMLKNTYGTGGFLLMNTGDRPVTSRSGLLTTIAWEVDGLTSYALEGSVMVSGSAIQWLRDELGLIDRADETEDIARAAGSNQGVYFVPAFTGMGTPHWQPAARGTIVGLTRGSGRDALVRATVEALAYQTADVVSAMEHDFSQPIRLIKADGGAASNRFLLQFQADILNKTIVRAATDEQTAFGAAGLSGHAAGFWDFNALVGRSEQSGESFEPKMAEHERQSLLRGWRRAVACALTWANDNSLDI